MYVIIASMIIKLAVTDREMREAEQVSETEQLKTVNVCMMTMNQLMNHDIVELTKVSEESAA